MLYNSTVGIAVNVRRFAFALIATALTLQPVSASQPPSFEARCYGPSLPLGSNLPLGTTSSATDIIDTHAIRGPVDQVAAWYYSNREGDKFIQVARGYESYIADLLSAAGAKAIAESVAASKPYAFFPVSSTAATAFERLADSRGIMQSCFSHPLGA